MRRKLSTLDLKDGDPVDFWREWLSNEFLPVEVCDYQSRGFYAECEFLSFGEIDITTFRGSQQTIARPRSLIRPSHSDNYVIVLKGTSKFDHNGHNVSGAIDDIVLFDPSQPYTISHETDESVMCVVIPRKALDSALGATQAAIGLSLNHADAITPIIRAFFGSI